MIKKILINSSIGLSLLTIGCFIGKRTIKQERVKYVGILRLDNSEPEEPTKIFLELNTNPDVFENCDYVNLKVLKENYVK